jgi:hypothetical protein
VLLHDTLGLLLRFLRLVQLCPQVPQLTGSVLVSTQVEPQGSGFGALQDDEQAGVLPAVEHRPVGLTHCFEQLPQVSGFVRSVSQPSSGVVVQWPNPVTQPAGWMTHLPAVHWTAGAVAPGFTWFSLLQSWLHTPQFLTSVCLLTHMVPQTSGDVPPQLGKQLAGGGCVEQRGVAPPHMSEQLPQLAGVLRSASHPSSGLLEQWA